MDIHRDVDAIMAALPSADRPPTWVEEAPDPAPLDPPIAGEDSMMNDDAAPVTEQNRQVRTPRPGWAGTLNALAKLFVVSVSIAATMAVAVRVFMFVAGA